LKEDELGRAYSTYGENRNACRISVGKPKGNRPKENLDIGDRVILKSISERQVVMIWTGLIWLRIGTSGGLS
jgi:hypothetical protein